MPIPHLTSSSFAAIPGIRHGFFTRQGGVSTGVYASLNCGRGSSDDPAAVVENRTRVARALGLADERLASVFQCHTPDVVIVDRPENGERNADAMVTTTPGLALGVLAADCGPVLFASGDGKVIGAAHAGWKGALHGVLENTVAAMEKLGSSRGAIRACLGPCIHQPSYEVGPEMRQIFVDHTASYAVFFAVNDKGRFQFDMPGFILHRLRALGLGAVAGLGLDTYADPARFFSYRRSTHAGEPDYGRQISAIAIVR